MRRTSRPLILAAAALAALVLASCSSGPSTSDVAWTDQVCGSVLKFTDAVTTQPNIDSSNPDAAVKGISDYLGTASTALQGSLDSLHTVGKSPVDGGDAVVSELDTTLTSVKSSFDTARTRLDAVDTSDPSALSTALTEALSPLQDVSKLQTSGLNSTPDLEAAAKQAPNCQKIQATTAG